MEEIKAKISLVNRFSDRFIPEPNSGCWLWCGTQADDGYGLIGGWNKTRGFHNIRAHRAAWLIYRGEISEHLHVCHKCDTPLCVNPEHLFLGTDKDNLSDMASKGRGRNQNSRKDTCRNGHVLDGENIYKYILRGKICRACRVCKSELSKKHNAIKKEKRHARKINITAG